MMFDEMLKGPRGPLFVVHPGNCSSNTLVRILSFEPDGNLFICAFQKHFRRMIDRSKRHLVISLGGADVVHSDQNTFFFFYFLFVSE